MDHCINLKDLTDADVSSMGQKIAGLVSLLKAGYPIPAGFLLMSTIFDDFFAQCGLKDNIDVLLSKINMNDYADIVRVSKEISDSILTVQFPQVLEDEILEVYRNFNVSDDMKNLNETAKNIIDAGRSDSYVALRASPVDAGEMVSFSGIYGSYYYVHGSVGIIKSIQKCIASYYSVKAIMYRFKNNIDHSKYFTIIIQEMINSEKSGVFTTANPVNSDKSQVVVESVWGLGVGITDGRITPDRHIIDKETGNVIEKIISFKEWKYIPDLMDGGLKKESVSELKKNERVLSLGELKVLFSLGEKIHDYFRRPQQIEWTIQKNRVYILQSIPLYVPQINFIEENNSDMPKTVLNGFGNSSKMASGVSSVVYNDADFVKISNNTIMVAGYASTDLVYPLLKASGVVTDAGGSLSNLAFISRELGIPMISGVNQATQKIPEGLNLVLNAKVGGVYELPPQASHTNEMQPMQSNDGQYGQNQNGGANLNSMIQPSMSQQPNNPISQNIDLFNSQSNLQNNNSAKDGNMNQGNQFNQEQSMNPSTDTGILGNNGGNVSNNLMNMSNLNGDNNPNNLGINPSRNFNQPTNNPEPNQFSDAQNCDNSNMNSMNANNSNGAFLNNNNNNNNVNGASFPNMQPQQQNHFLKDENNSNYNAGNYGVNNQNINDNQINNQNNNMNLPNNQNMQVDPMTFQNNQNINGAPVSAVRIKHDIINLSDLDSLSDKEDGVGCIDISLFSKKNTDNLNRAQQEQSIEIPESQATLETDSGINSSNIDTAFMGSFVEQFYPKDVWFLVSNLNENTIIEELAAIGEIVNRGYTTIGVVVPGITEPSQILAIRTAATTAGIDISKIKLGILVESAVQIFLAEEFSKAGINFALIDADLIANTLLYGTQITNDHATHPVIIKSICNTLKIFKNNRVYTSVKGVFLDNMDFVNYAISYGADSFTASNGKTNMVKVMAQRAEKAKMIDLLKDRHRMQFNHQ